MQNKMEYSELESNHLTAVLHEPTPTDEQETSPDILISRIMNILKRFQSIHVPKEDLDTLEKLQDITHLKILQHDFEYLLQEDAEYTNPLLLKFYIDLAFKEKKSRAAAGLGIILSREGYLKNLDTKNIELYLTYLEQIKRVEQYGFFRLIYLCSQLKLVDKINLQLIYNLKDCYKTFICLLIFKRNMPENEIPRFFQICVDLENKNHNLYLTIFCVGLLYRLGVFCRADQSELFLNKLRTLSSESDIDDTIHMIINVFKEHLNATEQIKDNLRNYHESWRRSRTLYEYLSGIHEPPYIDEDGMIAFNDVLVGLLSHNELERLQDYLLMIIPDQTPRAQNNPITTSRFGMFNATSENHSTTNRSDHPSCCNIS